MNERQRPLHHTGPACGVWRWIALVVWSLSHLTVLSMSAFGVGQQQMRVRRFDGCRGNLPIRFGLGTAIVFDDNSLASCVELHGRVLLSLLGHALANWVAGVKRVRLDVAELFVPRFGPVASLVAGQPEAVTRRSRCDSRAFVACGRL